MELFDYYGCSSSRWMIQQAKEELQNLEAQHPNRFGYLKLELQTFISSSSSSAAESEVIHNHNNQNNFNFCSSQASVSTQASTSRKRKKNCSQIQNLESNRNINNNAIHHHEWTNKQKSQRRFGIHDGGTASVDAAMERAEACLRKIQEVKDSFNSR